MNAGAITSTRLSALIAGAVPATRAAVASATNSCSREICVVIRMNIRAYQLKTVVSSQLLPRPCRVRPMVARVLWIHGPSATSPLT